MSDNKDEDFRIRQMTHRLEALKNGTEIPYVYKTKYEKQTDALFAFITNRSMRIVFYIIVILVMIFYKNAFIDVKGSEALLEKNNKLISIYGASAEPYQLYNQLDEDGRSLKIFGKTFGESKIRLQEIIERDKKREIIPTLFIWGNVALIITEIVMANRKPKEQETK